jgi:hypothetical protein
MPIVGPGGARRRGRRRGLIVGAAVGSAAARRNANSQQFEEPAEPQANSMDGQMEQLEKLGQLKKDGILTEDEFQAKKQQILGM